MKAQRDRRGGLPPHPEDKRALERINFDVSKWDQLNWYVQFAAKPMKQLSPGECLSLREEAWAIERTLARRGVGAESVPEIHDRELQQMHAFYLEALSKLASGGHVTLGPFELRINIMFGLVNEDVGGKGVLGNRFMTYRFARLLEQFPTAVSQCPYCKKLFLRSRRNARYCSRECQSVAVMREIRKAKKEG